MNKFCITSLMRAFLLSANAQARILTKERSEAPQLATKVVYSQERLTVLLQEPVCKLGSRCLRYRLTCITTQDKEAKGSIPLKGAKVMKPPLIFPPLREIHFCLDWSNPSYTQVRNSEKRQCSFEIDTGSRVYYIIAKTPTLQEDWIEAIQKAIDM